MTHWLLTHESSIREKTLNVNINPNVDAGLLIKKVHSLFLKKIIKKIQNIMK